MKLFSKKARTPELPVAAEPAQEQGYEPEQNTALEQEPEQDSEQEQMQREVNALYDMFANIYGTERLVLKAAKLDALNLMRSDNLAERVLALQRIIGDDPTCDKVPLLEEIPKALADINDQLADYIAKKALEDDLDKRINEKMQKRQDEYLNEIKMQIIQESEKTIENPQTLKKLAQLEEKDRQKLSGSVLQLIRPDSLSEIVGQERGIKGLLSKLASPYPQHVLLYGPPGVGKTTAARLALEYARKIEGSVFAENAPFVEADGTLLRWDPREITNPLLGSVHDPIYQGARHDLAESGVPEPKLGLVSDAHGGVLFLDEIGEMDLLLQNKLLKVLEDKKVYFDSPYYDPTDETVPQYIRKIFEEGAPADFILIGATTRSPQEINPAIRSRCAEVFFDPLDPPDIEKIVCEAAARLQTELDAQIPGLISNYTIEGRKAVSILADAYGVALFNHRQQNKITVADFYEITRMGRMTPYVTTKASTQREIGRIFGLGVSGFVGSVLEIEAAVFPTPKEKGGHVRFNDTAGSMAKDSVFNAAAVIRSITGKDLQEYDIHVNVIGGGNIDGPSAGAAITVAIYSVLENKPIRQDVALTGEISIQGRIKAVGGVLEKIYGARQAGIKTVLLPEENRTEAAITTPDLEIRYIEHINEVIEFLFAD